MKKILATAIAIVAVVVLVLAMTKPGRDIDAATQRFMLFYAGVFALIGLTGSVMVGLIATDRIFMTPGHRVMAQALHRAFSFGALAFLIIHIVTEILAQRVHVIDAVIPFMSPFRTFYIGLGTIASDLILLIVITSILRSRFTAHGKAWRWRAIHYSAYLAFVFGVLHGLLGGRAAKPYVDWSYGFAIAITALGLAIRVLAISLRPKESLPAPAGADRARSGGSSPLHAAALSMAQSQLGGTVQLLPAGLAGRGAGLPGAAGFGGDPRGAIPAPGWSASSGPFPALPSGTSTGPFPAASGPFPALGAEPALAGPGAGGYRDAGSMPFGAPVYGDEIGAGPFGSIPPSDRRYGGPPRPAPQPMYEPGYDGPPRYAGAPRGHLPQDDLSSYPYDSRHQAGAAPGRPGDRTPGSLPRAGSGPLLRADSGPMPRLGTGPRPAAGTGLQPVAGTGPQVRPGSGPSPRPAVSPAPKAGTGPIPRADTGPLPRVGTGPMPRADTGPMPRVGTGPLPRLDGERGPRAAGPPPYGGAGSTPHSGTGPMPRPDTGPIPRVDPAQRPRAARADTGPLPRLGPGPVPPAGTGPRPAQGTGPRPAMGTTPQPSSGTAPQPASGADPRSYADPPAQHHGAHRSRANRKPKAPARPPGQTDSADPRHQMPRPDRGDEWR